VSTLFAHVNYASWPSQKRVCVWLSQLWSVTLHSNVSQPWFFCPRFHWLSKFWLHEILWYQLLTCSINTVSVFSVIFLLLISQFKIILYFLSLIFSSSQILFCCFNFEWLFATQNWYSHINIIIVHRTIEGVIMTDHYSAVLIRYFSVEIGCFILRTSRLIVYLAQFG
jgi:hypothetical protein